MNPMSMAPVHQFHRKIKEKKKKKHKEHQQQRRQREIHNQDKEEKEQQVVQNEEEDNQQEQTNTGALEAREQYRLHLEQQKQEKIDEVMRIQQEIMASNNIDISQHFKRLESLQTVNVVKNNVWLPVGSMPQAQKDIQQMPKQFEIINPQKSVQIDQEPISKRQVTVPKVLNKKIELIDYDDESEEIEELSDQQEEQPQEKMINEHQIGSRVEQPQKESGRQEIIKELPPRQDQLYKTQSGMFVNQDVLKMFQESGMKDINLTLGIINKRLQHQGQQQISDVQAPHDPFVRATEKINYNFINELKQPQNPVPKPREVINVVDEKPIFLPDQTQAPKSLEKQPDVIIKTSTVKKSNIDITKKGATSFVPTQLLKRKPAQQQEIMAPKQTEFVSLDQSKFKQLVDNKSNINESRPNKQLDDFFAEISKLQ